MYLDSLTGKSILRNMLETNLMKQTLNIKPKLKKYRFIMMSLYKIVAVLQKYRILTVSQWANITKPFTIFFLNRLLCEWSQ